MKLLVVGHSHVEGVRDAARALHAAGLGADFAFVQLRDEAFVNDPTQDETQVGDRLREAIAQHGADCDASLLMLAGNAYNGLSLFEHPEPFDFVLDEDPDLPLDSSRSLVPSALLAAHLQRWAPFALPNAQRRRLLPLLPRPIGQTDAPPPIADNDVVVSLLLDAQRRSPRALRGIAPAGLRHKVWRLHSRLLADECRSLGLPLLPAPAAAVDAPGFLARPAWGQDVLHPNAWYGAQVLQQALQQALQQTLQQVAAS
ncbi:MAG: hypothetical protein IV093_05430 [Rubrivivax sp.]|nr:hypothetical protein [Rubrivivax sp.]